MRYIRNISDDQNKSGDTDNIFRFNLLQGDDIFNFGDYPISINIANSSGYILSMVPEKEFGNSVLKLDFNDQSLKSLTPDNYLLEVEVKFPDGTTATFPTKGGMPFSVNSNLKNTAGHLVPTVTFDEVLSAVDKKVNNYLATVVKGDKGDKGDTGVVDTTADYTWTGSNTFNKQIIAPAGVQGNADTATKLQTSRSINGVGFDGTSDITVEPVARWINSATDVFTLDNGFYYISSLEHSPNSPVNSTSFFTVEVIQMSSNGFMRLIDHEGKSFWTTKSGDKWGEWHQDADDSTVMHLTGDETVSGDKTFTGNNSFTQLVNGALNSTRLVQFTDFSDVANGNMIKYAGFWFNQTKDIQHTPTGDVYWSSIDVVPTTSSSGYIMVNYQISGDTYITGVDNYAIKGWYKVANSSTTVHNTGTETVAGDKTFTGNNNFSGATTIQTGNYGLRVTNTGVQKTSDGGTTWVNI